MTQTVITRDRDTRVVVVRERSRVETVTTQRAPVEVVSRGRQGPPGANGAPGAPGANGANGDGQYPVVEFAFGDASPAPVLTINPASAAEIVLVQLEIEEPFDGAGATLTVGTAADPDLLMAADQVDPSTTAVFEASPRVALAGGAEVQLTITPGVGASQGRGKLVIQATPTT